MPPAGGEPGVAAGQRLTDRHPVQHPEAAHPVRVVQGGPHRHVRPAVVPDDGGPAVAERVEQASDADRQKIVVEAAVELSQRLLDGGAPGLHLYGLNRSEVLLDLVAALGLADR